MDLKRLAAFLETANKMTYTNRTMPKAPSTRPGSLDCHFEQDVRGVSTRAIAASASTSRAISLRVHGGLIN